MGFSMSWIAVPAKSREVALTLSGYLPTGDRESIPESPAVAVDLPSGWFVVLENDVSTALTGNTLLQQLSRAVDVVTCTVEEHSMVSVAAHWQGGVRAWEVLHDAGSGLASLEVVGEPPLEVNSLRNAAIERQTSASRSVDYMFGVPVALAKMLVGFRHDEDIDGAAEEPFEVLVKR